MPKHFVKCYQKEKFRRYFINKKDIVVCRRVVSKNLLFVLFCKEYIIRSVMILKALLLLMPLGKRRSLKFQSLALVSYTH